MPVVKRLVQPIHCSREPIPKGVKDELEAFAVNSLSSVILQLSSLAKHSEGIFAELYTEATSIHRRTVSAQQRLDQLAIKVTKLDSAGEEISLQEINMQKAFKLTIHSDQQVISKKTLPEAMQGAYQACDPVPDLQSLTKFRHDGKDSLKFYTDPDYFFELWKEKMSAEFEKRRKKRKRENRGRKRDVTEKKQVKGVKRREIKNIPDWEIKDHAKKSGSGSIISEPTLAPDQREPSLSPSHSVRSSETSSPHLSPRRQSTKRASNASSVGRPTSAPPPPPPGNSPARHPGGPPPPPPPPGQQISPRHMSPSPPNAQSPLPPPPAYLMDQSMSNGPAPPPPPPMSGGPPPPPPPPPPPGMGAPPPPSSGSAPPPPSSGINTNILQSVKLSAPKPAPEPEPDSRNGLLSAIRTGMNLRKTAQVTMEEKKESSMGNDVASILARRIAVEFSDSEDDSDESDGEWSDE